MSSSLEPSSLRTCCRERTPDLLLLLPRQSVPSTRFALSDFAARVIRTTSLTPSCLHRGSLANSPPSLASFARSESPLRRRTQTPPSLLVYVALSLSCNVHAE